MKNENSKVGDQLRDYLQAKITVYKKRADEECGRQSRKHLDMVYELSEILHELRFPARMNDREQELLDEIEDLTNGLETSNVGR